jgi:hypothetical protein
MQKQDSTNKEKKPEIAVMTVEEMGMYAGIKRQTVYDYLRRWLMLQILKKTTFVQNGTIITGYELNGSNLENVFRKAEVIIKEHVERSIEYTKELQNEIKKEKLKLNRQAENEEELSDQS